MQTDTLQKMRANPAKGTRSPVGGAPVQRRPQSISPTADNTHSVEAFSNTAQPNTPNTTAQQLKPGSRVAAVTYSATRTAFAPATLQHPRAKEIVAHETIHRQQHAARGSAPIGTHEQLEAEARRGSQVVLHGRQFSPRLAAPDGEALAYEHASAGGWLLDFTEFLIDTTTYDIAGIDWESMIADMLASDNVMHSNLEFTALELSNRWRYQFLLEIFSQEIEIEDFEEPAVGPPVQGLTRPSLKNLEDTLLDSYLPLVDASMFDPEDVANVSEAFIEHWLEKIEGIALVPASFNLESFRPARSSDDIEHAREVAFSSYMTDEVPDLMFMFVLDEFAKDVAGTAAEVNGAPLIVGGGEMRTLSPEQWLATLDVERLRTRMVTHVGDEFEKRLKNDPDFRNKLLSGADEMSRYLSLAAIHGAFSGQEEDIINAGFNLRELPLAELDVFDNQVMSEPEFVYRRMMEVQIASSAFYEAIEPGFDNDSVLTTAVDALIDALDRPGDYDALAAILRVVTFAGSLSKLLKDQFKAARRRIDEEIELSFDDVAETIAEMAEFAAKYLNEKWIPALHRSALKRITANRDTLQALKDNWTTHNANLVADLEGGALILDTTASDLEAGLYESATIESGSSGTANGYGGFGGNRNETVTAVDAYRLRDAATIMLAEAAALKDPEKNSERYDKIVTALDGFEDVKQRIEDGDVDPNLYGPDVMTDAKNELGLNTFAEFTTYGDVILGREIASSNPFLARLVVAWKMVEVIDDALTGIVILAAIGLMTVASILSGGLGAAAFWVMFTVDAMISIGIGIHQVSAAEALLELIRLDLDQSITGMSVEQAENALFWAWVGLAIAIVFAVGVPALGLAIRYGTRIGESVAISLRYYKLAVEQPTLFNSLRRIVRDPLRLSRMLDLAGDALDLEMLLHRIDSTMDLARAERLLELTGDASRVNNMLDTGSSARSIEVALDQMDSIIPNTGVRNFMFDSVSNDIVALPDILAHTGTTPEALVGLSRTLDNVPADRLLPLLNKQSISNVDDLLDAGHRLENIEFGVGVPGGGGMSPVSAEPRVPIPADIRALLVDHRVLAESYLTELNSFEVSRIRNVLTSNKFPKKAGTEVGPAVARWAADGANSPVQFWQRWEYARERYKIISATNTSPPAGSISSRRVAADRLVAEINSGQMTTMLNQKNARVRALAGSGTTNVSGTTSDDILSSVRAKSNDFTFGSETSTSYHMHKHLDELPESALPAAPGNFDLSLSSYIGHARQTIATGEVSGGELVDGARTFVFRPLGSVQSGTDLGVVVRVQDGAAQITTFSTIRR